MISPKILETLEFPKILQQLAQHTSFSAGKELALALEPAILVSEVSRLQTLTSEAVTVLDIRPGVTLGGVRDIRGAIQRAVLGSVVDPAGLLDVASTIQGARSIRGIILKLAAGGIDLPLLVDLAGAIVDQPWLEEEISRCIDDQGNVVDAASGKLARLRADVRATSSRVRERLQAMLATANIREAVQEPIVTMRGDRFVLPVKAQFKGRVPGIVHDQSSTGQTLFIEPMAVVELNNHLRQLELEETQEVERILLSLAESVADRAPDLTRMVEILAQLDLHFAKARYATALRAVPPVLRPRTDPESHVHLIAARHPLISPDLVVPITIYLGGDFRVLVITGPNTGGKTVALKTTGLLTAMAQAGMHIPADEGSSVLVFGTILADIGDEQSIEQSLSTFSSHLSHIVAFLRQVDGDSLVLLDELGAGTDPTEGAALARAIIEELVRRECLAIATTHYAELKSFAYSTPMVENAAVDFDVETLSPTYRLSIGVPGRSNALAIAQRLGLDTSVVQRARELLTPAEVEIEELLAGIQAEHEQLRTMRQEAEGIHKEVSKLRRDLSRQLHEIDATREEVIEEARREVDEELAEIRRELKRLTKELRTSTVTREWLSQASRRAQEVQATAEVQIPRPKPEPDYLDRTGRPVRPGDRVMVQSLQQQGDVLALADSGEAVDVQLGSFKARLPIKDVVRMRARQPEPEESRNVHVPIAPAPPPVEIDLRGRRANDIQVELERYLNDAYLSGLPFVRLIHGKGTGVLRQVVRDILSGHPLVEAYESGGPQDGGEGVTIAKLART